MAGSYSCGLPGGASLSLVVLRRIAILPPKDAIYFRSRTKDRAKGVLTR